MSRDKLDRVLLGHEYGDEPVPTFPGTYSGTVSKVTAKGAYFTMPSYSRDVEFGPARWPNPGQTTTSGTHEHDMTPGTPPKGTKCAVAFADGDPDQPLVLALYGWPP